LVQSWGFSGDYIFLKTADSENIHVLTEYHFSTKKAQEISERLSSQAKSVSEKKEIIDPLLHLDVHENANCPPDPLLANFINTKNFQTKVYFHSHSKFHFFFSYCSSILIPNFRI